MDRRPWPGSGGGDGSLGVDPGLSDVEKVGDHHKRDTTTTTAGKTGPTM